MAKYYTYMMIMKGFIFAFEHKMKYYDIKR